MTDQMRTAREDLAFLRAMADDDGTPPEGTGAHLLAIGVPFGLNFILVWAVYAELLPWWPPEKAWATWIPGAVVYGPLYLFLHLRYSRRPLGPTAKLFGTAWAAVGLLILPLLATMVVAGARTEIPFIILWPSLSFVLWGGAWASLGVIRRKLWHGAVALAAFATALASAALMGTPESWLVMAAGLLLSVGAPGAAIFLKARRAA